MIFAGCDSNPVDPAEDADFYVDLSLAGGTDGWEADIADYPSHNLEGIDFVAEHRSVTGDLPGGYYLAGTNHPDDLFMFVKSQISGLQPETHYRAEFAVEFTSNTPSKCIGVGGSPGEAVWLKTGATAEEPKPTPVDGSPDEYIRMNVDKGSQGEDGSDAIVIGNVGNGLECEKVWRTKKIRSTKDFVAQTDAGGSLWLIVGTDSGHESRTEIIISRLRAWFWSIE